ncbi:MAG: hypothetical protein IPH49_14695 [Ignavibacteria bacterium]|nr:hypothetical protein [Ignavibacteria bacterium]
MLQSLRPLTNHSAPLQKLPPINSNGALLGLVGYELKALVKNRPFIIIVVIGLINLIASLTTFTDGYGGAQYPVTYNVLSTVIGGFSSLLLVSSRSSQV